MKQPKPLRPLWSTTVTPEEYDYLGQFSNMVKQANRNKECFCSMDVGKVWGLVQAYERLKKGCVDIYMADGDSIAKLRAENATLRGLLGDAADTVYAATAEEIGDKILTYRKQLHAKIRAALAQKAGGE